MYSLMQEIVASKHCRVFIFTEVASNSQKQVRFDLVLRPSVPHKTPGPR